MKAVVVKSKSDKNKFLKFRKEIFKLYPHFVDNDYFVLKELFFGKSSFTDGKDIIPINIENKRGLLYDSYCILTGYKQPIL